MIRHYLNMSIRSLKMQGIYAWIDIVGLAVGITVSALIALFILQEMSVDRFHPGVERIFRIAHDRKVNGEELQSPYTPPPLAPRLARSFPGVESACRLRRETRAVAFLDRRFREEKLLYADPGCLEVFHFQFVAGESRSALRSPNTVILTEEMARKYFGKEPALGKSLIIGGEGYTVVGVIEDLSWRSHLAFDFLVSMVSLQGHAQLDRWSAHNCYTYVKLRPGYRAQDLKRELAGLVDRELGPMFAAGIGKTFSAFRHEGQRFGYFLQPLADIHLDSHMEYELKPNGDRRLVISLAALALLVLLIACINHTNLSTARASKRALEIGLRKTLGAEQGQLIAQFLCEALITTFIAGGLAVLFLALLWHPATAYLDGETLVRVVTNPWGILLVLAGLGLLAVLSSGYPAFILSAIHPLSMLKQSKGQGSQGKRLRSALVVFQFTVAIALMAMTLVIHRQMMFLDQKDLGFQPSGVLVINGLDALGERWDAFKQEVLRIPGVVAASAANSMPGRWIPKGYLYPGTSTRQEDLVTTWVLETDADIVKTLGLHVTEGRIFSSTDLAARNAVLVNPMISDRLGWPSPVGKLVTVGKVRATVQGVFANTYLESLHHPLGETVIRPLISRPRVMAVRIEEQATQKVIPQIAACWKRFAPDQPFDTSSLAQEIATMYEPERRLMRIISFFTLSAVFLSCLGIAGLSAFITEQRVREVGIRKAIGATIGQVAVLLTWDLVGLVVLALAVAVPFAWYASHRWLASFTVRTDIPWWFFPAAGALIIGVALITVGCQSLRAALSNPADCLRYE